ncbi:MAG: hypothetical protein ACM3MD_08690 [Betaproteobacteria bacterium]
MSGSSDNEGMLNPDSPMRTDVPSRSELVVYNYDTTAGPVFFTGTGLNDMTASGTFTGTANRSFRIQIDSVDAPDTFSWLKSAPTQTIPDATLVPISAETTTLIDGMTITFGAATGHTAGDRWDFITKRAVERLALDGSICSSSTSVAGVTTYSPAGCTPLLPNSYATGNEIEDADSAYFGAGGGIGGGGGGGGGPIAPGY